MASWLFGFIGGIGAALAAVYALRLQKRPGRAEKHAAGAEVQNRTLRVVNDVSAMLLGSDVSTYELTLFTCMERIGVRVGVDRVYIWRNQVREGVLYTSQVYEWSGGAEPQQGNTLTISVPFPEDWYSRLSTNQCVNGIVRTFIGRERSHLEAQGIVSILVVPVFLHGEFWGFVGFDDCHSERVFSEGEEAVLRSVSLLFATSQLRNEMTVSLMQAKEEALTSSKAKTNFLASMSHEIRTPINAITGMSSIARMSDDKNRIITCLDRIDAASQQLLALINDVLDMSKIESGKMELEAEPFDLTSTLYNIRSIIAVRAEEKQQTFEIDIDPNLPKVVVGDDMRISQVLINILANAVKFTPDRGRVTLRARRVGSRMEDGREMDELEFSVSDNGIGIAKDNLGRLFGKFEQVEHGVTRRYGGSGLGLSICKSIVELMGGSIEVESELGKGSCFTVRFAVQRESENKFAPAASQTDKPHYDFSGYRALLVEDVAVNREIVLALLADSGLNIDEAPDGQVALEVFKAAPERYDLIFMDIHMPMMDGYTATRAIRALENPRAKSVPIIAMTANAFTEDVQRCLDAGMNDHIAKPVNFELLLQKIDRYLSSAK